MRVGSGYTLILANGVVAAANQAFATPAISSLNAMGGNPTAVTLGLSAVGATTFTVTGGPDPNLQFSCAVPGSTTAISQAVGAGVSIAIAVVPWPYYVVKTSAATTVSIVISSSFGI
jgi:hypothetical protein